MLAIAKLRRCGYTTGQIAKGIGDKSGGHLVRMYERGLRFPGRKSFVCIVEMAELHGVKLLARDFIAAGEACEPDSNDS
jgi:hypothetical protein